MSTNRPKTWTTPWRASPSTPPKARPSPLPCWATLPKSCLNWSSVACARTWLPTRPAPTIRSTVTCRPAGPGNSTATAPRPTPQPWSRPPSNRWPCTYRPCSISRSKVSRPSITATTSVRWPRKKASAMPSISRASYRPTSVRCSAAVSVRSAGRRCRAMPKTSTRPTPRSRN
ncbi:hypothetical protein D3C78_1340340 [compost metagenome]